MLYKNIIKDLYNKENPAKAKILSSFFKTGKGEYGEGDKFLGIQVPAQREIAKNYFQKSSFEDVSKLFLSEFHEVRLTGFLILCYKYEYYTKKQNSKQQKLIVDFYLSNLNYANNWDLVDLVAYKILGNYLLNKDRTILYELVKDSNMWKQRVAIISTMAFVKKGDFSDTLKISEILLSHNHDLIHKAVGRLLREVGKQDEKILRYFLDTHINEMSRTTLRYAIERLDVNSRKKYLNM